MFTRLIKRVSSYWQRLPLAFQKRVLILLPLLALLVSAITAFVGNLQREQTEGAVTRHFELVSNYEEALILMVNAETGMRGYLLTRRPEFLQPFEEAQRSLPAILASLRQTIQQEPGQEPRERKTVRLNHIEILQRTQMQSLTALRQLSEAQSPAADNLYPLLRQGKTIMDKLRDELHTMRGEEKTLLAERLSDIQRVRRRDYIAVFVTLVLGLGSRLLASYLFDTGVNRRIERIQENLHAIQAGKEPPWPPSGRPDAIGALEQEVAALRGG